MSDAPVHLTTDEDWRWYGRRMESYANAAADSRERLRDLEADVERVIERLRVRGSGTRDELAAALERALEDARRVRRAAAVVDERQAQLPGMHTCPTTLGGNVWPAEETFNDTTGRVCCKECGRVLGGGS